MKISFANTLSNICERIPDAQIDDITTALGSDKRVSPYYLTGGLAFGGTCFPKDNRAFMAFANRYGVDATLAEATDTVNESQAKHLTDTVLSIQAANGDRRVSILGLAFKANTPVIEESPAIKLIRSLLEENMDVTVYDPLAMDLTKEQFGDAIAYAPSVEICVSRSPLWVVTTGLDEFQAIDDDYVTHNPTTLIDCWRVIDPARFSKKVNYVALGRFSPWNS